MTTSRTSWQNLRRGFLWTIIVSFSLAALAGIAVLLGAELGDTGARVIGSTVLVGAYGLAMLCCGAVFERPERLIGVAGVVVSALSLGFSLVLVWSDAEGDWWFFQVLFTGITLTVAISFVSLLLALSRYRDQALRVLIPITLSLFVLASALILFAVWEGPGFDTDLFGRITGIVLILAVLCGVVTPILSTLRGRAEEQTAPASENGGEVSQASERNAPMSTTELFADLAHRPIVAAKNLPPLTAEQLNAHPGGHPNSIAWLLWHSGREVDVQLSRLTGKKQLWENYRKRFQLGEIGESVGYGHTAEKAAQITVESQHLLIDYLEESLTSLSEYAAELSAADLADVIDDSWDTPVTRGTRLVSIIDDAIQHVAQAAYVAGALTR